MGRPARPTGPGCRVRHAARSAPRGPTRRFVGAALFPALVALAPACGPDEGPGPAVDALTVLASPSLVRAADSLAAGWPGEAEVVVEVAPTPVIVTRLGESESAPDVLLLDDSRDMSALWVAGEIAEAYRLGTDRLVLVVAGDDPAGVRGVVDLGRDGVEVSLPDSAVPLGRRAREIFRSLGIEEAVEENRTGDPADVDDVLEAVVAGRADAGLAYASSVTADLRQRLRVLPLPQAISRPETLAIGIPNGAARPETARAFVDHALSTEGRAALASLGIGAPR